MTVCNALKIWQYNDANDNDANDVIKELSDSLSKQF